MASNIKIAVDLKSLDKLVRNLQRDLPEVAEDVVTMATMQIERTAKEKCPVDTGRLRDSIHSDIEKDSDGTTGSVGTDVEYGPHVELGTSKMQAQPFMKPAMDENKEDIISYANYKLKETIKKGGS